MLSVSNSSSRTSICAVLLALISALLLARPAQAHELRAALAPQCPTTLYPKSDSTQTESILGPLAISIASSLAGTLIDTGVAALKKKVNPGNASTEAKFLHQGLYAYRSVVATTTGTTATTAVELSPSMECLVVALGTFSAPAEGEEGKVTLPFESLRSPAETYDGLNKSLDIKGQSTFALYMEAAKKTSPDRTAVTWQPVRLYVGEYLNESFFAGKSRSTQVEVRLYRPAGDKPFYSQVFAFDEVRKPLSKGPDQLQIGNVGQWGVLPAPPNVPQKFAPNKDGRPFDPFTLEVRIVEAPKPYALATALADAVDKNKDEIKALVREEIDPAFKQKNELAGESTTVSAVSDYLTSWSDAKAKCVKEKKTDDAGKLTCVLSLDKARITKGKADAACGTYGVASCRAMPSVDTADSPV